MNQLKYALIGFFMQIGNQMLFSQEIKSDFSFAIDSIINTSIDSGVFRGYPMIIIEGHPMSDTIMKEKVFSALNVMDIKGFETLSYNKSSQFFAQILTAFC